MHMGPFSTWGLQSPFSRRPLRYALHLDKVSFIDELVLTCLFLCVYVCILCVCVCVYSFTVIASSVCNYIWDIVEGKDQLSCVVSIILGASVKFLYLRF